jgi:hypothetical protein
MFVHTSPHSLPSLPRLLVQNLMHIWGEQRRKGGEYGYCDNMHNKQCTHLVEFRSKYVSVSYSVQIWYKASSALDHTSLMGYLISGNRHGHITCHPTIHLYEKKNFEPKDMQYFLLNNDVGSSDLVYTLSIKIQLTCTNWIHPITITFIYCVSLIVINFMCVLIML